MTELTKEQIEELERIETEKAKAETATKPHPDAELIAARNLQRQMNNNAAKVEAARLKELGNDDLKETFSAMDAANFWLKNGDAGQISTEALVSKYDRVMVADTLNGPGKLAEMNKSVKDMEEFYTTASTKAAQMIATADTMTKNAAPKGSPEGEKLLNLFSNLGSRNKYNIGDLMAHDVIANQVFSLTSDPALIQSLTGKSVEFIERRYASLVEANLGEEQLAIRNRIRVSGEKLQQDILPNLRRKLASFSVKSGSIKTY